MLVEHPLAKGSKLLPFISTILNIFSEAAIERYGKTHNKTFIPNRSWKIAIKRDLIIVWVISLVCDYVII